MRYGTTARAWRFSTMTATGIWTSISHRSRASPNRLYRNDGDAAFTDVAAQAGVDATDSNSTGVAACDIDNDGFQDLYVGAWGIRGDGLGFRSPQQGSADRLYRNNGAGGFADVTQAAFGDAVNRRSATGIACADVNNDGWLDIYVGNLLDDDFRVFEDYHHPGHYNLLYINNADGTFSETAQAAGVAGPSDKDGGFGRLNGYLHRPRYG